MGANETALELAELDFKHEHFFYVNPLCAPDEDGPSCDSSDESDSVDPNNTDIIIMNQVESSVPLDDGPDSGARHLSWFSSVLLSTSVAVSLYVL